MDKACERCGVLFRPTAKRTRFCSRDCYVVSGGRTILPSGYAIVYRPDNPNAWSNGQIFELRVVVEERLGRYLLPHENVHHKNGQRADNRPENLELWVKKQPQGQRVRDLVEFACRIIEEYGELVEAHPDL